MSSEILKCESPGRHFQPYPWFFNILEGSYPALVFTVWTWTGQNISFSSALVRRLTSMTVDSPHHRPDPYPEYSQIFSWLAKYFQIPIRTPARSASWPRPPASRPRRSATGSRTGGRETGQPPLKIGRRSDDKEIVRLRVWLLKQTLKDVWLRWRSPN